MKLSKNDKIEVKLDLITGIIGNQFLAGESASKLNQISQRLNSAEPLEEEQREALLTDAQNLQNGFNEYRKSAFESITLYNKLFGEDANKRFEKILSDFEKEEKKEPNEIETAKEVTSKRTSETV